MFAHALRRAPIARRSSPQRIAIAALGCLWLAFVGALFADWLATSGAPSSGGAGAEAGACVSLGRGGRLCRP